MGSTDFAHILWKNLDRGDFDAAEFDRALVELINRIIEANRALGTPNNPPDFDAMEKIAWALSDSGSLALTIRNLLRPHSEGALRIELIRRSSGKPRDWAAWISDATEGNAAAREIEEIERQGFKTEAAIAQLMERGWSRKDLFHWRRLRRAARAKCQHYFIDPPEDRILEFLLFDG